MKKIIYSLFICAAFVFAGCDDDTQDRSIITYFIDLQLEGEAVMFWPQGTAFEEPGYVAISGGEDVSSEVIVTGTVNANVPGMYTITYTAVNEDGFAKELKRNVGVYNTTPSDMESGYYTVSRESYRDYNGIVSYGNDYQIFIIQTEPGIFYVSDFLGGWYEQRAGYGPAYAMVGHFKLNADNTIEAIDSYVAGWNDSMESLTNGVYNPAGKEIRYVLTYTANPLIFHVNMKKS